MAGQKSYTGRDWSNHNLAIFQSPNAMRYILHRPGTSFERVVLINSDGILAITGDFGNFIFCREFSPEKDGTQDIQYWAEKAKISSLQQVERYDSDATEKELQRMIETGLEEYGYEGEELREAKQFMRDCLRYTSTEFEYMNFAYNNRPGGFDPEMLVFIKSHDHQLMVVLDAYNEMCHRLKSGNYVQQS